ncbi:hypothetical protein [Rhodococcus rhodochrous]|uniref:hypothetical protein n=1 Tax=Rhodococcus rhodochrous TaxID=1829 RepID=UPI001786045F|nr:hypothetical protein [Rhodococcus rhodochrous]
MIKKVISLFWALMFFSIALSVALPALAAAVGSIALLAVIIVATSALLAVIIVIAKFFWRYF